MPVSCVYRGTLAHSTRDTPLQILEDSVLGVDHRGKIAFIEEGQNVESLSQTWGFETSDIVQLGQYIYLQKMRNDKKTKKIQSFQTSNNAKKKQVHIHKVLRVQKSIFGGITLVVFNHSFVLLHQSYTLLLDDFKVFSSWCKSSIFLLIIYLRDLLIFSRYARVKPVVTPRFAVSCSSSLLHTLGEIAKNNDLHIQSHISENKEEVKLVKQLFPDCRSYTDVYLKHDLLTPKVRRVILEKFLNLGDDRNIVEVFVAGRRVVPFPE
uniref:Uncharacterized protein n=1 Tax=Astyanax mexicanus TaxID=7994 RepID=A0A8B9RC58_ASTMX